MKRSLATLTSARFPEWYKLGEAEQMWAKFQPCLEQMGHILRPRHRPGWVLVPGMGPWDDESAVPADGEVLDATEISDGAQVVLKLVDTFPPDSRISWFLTNEPGAQDHSLPLLGLIPIGEDLAFMVMPRMRGCASSKLFRNPLSFYSRSSRASYSSRTLRTGISAPKPCHGLSRMIPWWLPLRVAVDP
ncbi:hypothetical protein DFH07DRAFT_275898 [Mycena maculata]|uniref:Uncharacterized protein n=1 Tax=Mycena maculata TaxID=230809 RepID=A0AAD7MMK0_9AGAR|nr:hypothetical protein DFH07DRAFT_275898 [Mycena maculata]